jgi:hypothetical protein
MCHINGMFDNNIKKGMKPMDFKEEDFPVYQQIVKLDPDSARFAIAGFNAAVAGGEAEKVQFAFGIQTIAANVLVGEIVGVTQEMNEKTLQSCLAIFKEAAKHGDFTATLMVDDFKLRGLGEASKSPPSPKR